MIPENRGDKFSSGFLHSGSFFWKGGARSYSATRLIVALSPGNRDITRFRPWSQIVTGNRLDRAEKIPKFAQRAGAVDVFDPRSGISGPT